jgi:hypothetical protein
MPGFVVQHGEVMLREDERNETKTCAADPGWQC